MQQYGVGRWTKEPDTRKFFRICVREFFTNSFSFWSADIGDDFGMTAFTGLANQGIKALEEPAAPQVNEAPRPVPPPAPDRMPSIEKPLPTTLPQRMAQVEKPELPARKPEPVEEKTVTSAIGMLIIYYFV